MRKKKQIQPWYTKCLLLILSFLLGCCCLGCRTAPVSYTIQTDCPDVWAEQPTQRVSVKMEFRR